MNWLGGGKGGGAVFHGKMRKDNDPLYALLCQPSEMHLPQEKRINYP